jgi:hypothetical protein
MAGPGNFVQTLVDYAEQIGDVSPLVTLRDSLFAKIQTGGAKTLVNASVNGKSFGWEQTSMTNEELFRSVVRAIKIFNGDAGSGPITFIDFSGANALWPPA